MKLGKFRGILELADEHGAGDNLLFFSDQDGDLYTVHDYLDINDGRRLSLLTSHDGDTPLSICEVLEMFEDYRNYMDLYVIDSRLELAFALVDFHVDDDGDLVFDIIYNPDALQ